MNNEENEPENSVLYVLSTANQAREFGAVEKEKATYLFRRFNTTVWLLLSR